MQPAKLDAPLSLKVPAGQFTSAVPLQYCPGGVDTHELAPAALWPPEQPVQVSLAPTLNVLAGQFSSALLPPFGFFPAPAVRQKADPAVENCPAPSQAPHSSSLAAPVSLNFPAGQFTSALPLQNCPGGWTRTSSHQLRCGRPSSRCRCHSPRLSRCWLHSQLRHSGQHLAFSQLLPRCKKVNRRWRICLHRPHSRCRISLQRERTY